MGDSKENLSEDIFIDLEQIKNGQSLILHWNYQGLKHLPETLFSGSCQNLKEIYLKRNTLTELPNALGALRNLQTLYLPSNNIKQLPESIGQLENLLILDVASNSLRSVPDSIGQCLLLETLRLSGNKLKSLPKSIGQLKKLCRLDLFNNEFEVFPMAIIGCCGLNSLCLDNNQLQQLPVQICQLQCLQELSVCRNNLVLLPHTLGQMTFLRCLYLDNNPILNTLPLSLVISVSCAGPPNNQSVWNRKHQLKELGFFNCGIKDVREYVEHACYTKLQFNTKSKTTLVLPRGFTAGSNRNAIVSLMEITLRQSFSTIKQVSDKFPDGINPHSQSELFKDGHIPETLSTLLKNPVARCIIDSCATPIFTFAFPVVISGCIERDTNAHFIGFACSQRCLLHVVQCSSSHGFSIEHVASGVDSEAAYFKSNFVFS